MVPLSKQQQASSPASTFPTTTPMSILVANVDTTSSAAKYARYIHQILCSPPTATLLQALDSSTKLITIPGLTPTLICTHLPCSTATDKGHMRHHRANTAPHKICRKQLPLPKRKWTACSPYMRHVPCKICFALQHWPMPTQVPCTAISPGPSQSNPSGTCNMCLLHMCMI
jgi:hypothetical protein